MLDGVYNTVSNVWQYWFKTSAAKAIVFGRTIWILLCQSLILYGQQSQAR